MDNSILQIILIIGDVETHPSPGTYNSNPPVHITNNTVDTYISLCNINIRSVRNKLSHYDVVLTPLNQWWKNL